MKITFNNKQREKLAAGDIVKSKEFGYIAAIVEWENVYYVVNLEDYKIEFVAAFQDDLVHWELIGHLDDAELIIN